MEPMQDYPNYPESPVVTSSYSASDNSESGVLSTIFAVLIPAGITIVIVIIVYVILFFLNLPPKLNDSVYGSFDGTVAFSYSLDNVLSENFDRATREAVILGLNDYYLKDYPSGVGLTLISYGNFGNSSSFRVISSLGKIETFMVTKNQTTGNVKIAFEEFENEYPLDYIKYPIDEEDEDWD